MERKVRLILSLSCFRRHEGVHPPRVKSLFDCIIVQAIILNQKNEVNLISVDQSKGIFGKEGEQKTYIHLSDAYIQLLYEPFFLYFHCKFNFVDL